TYSPQEGTKAAEMADDVPESVKRQRLEMLMELQRQITAERYERFIGRTARAMIDRVVDGEAQGRTVWQADDVEGIEDDVDFNATLLRVIDAPGAPPKRVRSLPMLAQSIGSFGR